MLARALPASRALPQSPPKAAVRNVTDEYFATRVVDSYRWTENERSMEFVKFLKAQADDQRGRLDKFPLQKELFDPLENLDASAPNSAFAVQKLVAGDKYVYLKQPRPPSKRRK